MTALEDRLEQAGADIRDSVAVAEPASGHDMRRRQHRRTALRSATGLVAVAVLAISAARILPDTASDVSRSTSEQPSGFAPYGVDLPAPWQPGGIAHDEGAYEHPYWEAYYYLPTEDGEHASVVVRVTTRQVAGADEERAGIPDPSTSAAFATETIGGRDYIVSLDQGTYTYIWREGRDVIVELVVIQMAPAAVTEQLATSVLSRVTDLSAEQVESLEQRPGDIPSGPATTAPIDD